MPAAPVALFAYRRTDHLSQTLDALEACPEFGETRVFVFSDGPKPGSPEAVADVAAVRAMLTARARPNMTVLEAETNRGLAASITAGVTRLCDEFGRVIVIEDDLIVHPSTLTWFNAALERFQDDERVWQVSAHQFDVPAFAGRTEGVFLHLTTSWGWATWKRAWDRYDPEAKGWEDIATDAELRRRFDLDGAYPYSAMLERQMTGRADSWAIRWWWSVCKGGGTTLFPPVSLVENIGFDQTATHFGRTRLLHLFSPARKRVVHAPTPPQTYSTSEADDQAVRRAIGKRNGLFYWLVGWLEKRS